MQEGWGRSRWWEFRIGHSTYLIFMLTFVNFILISHRLLIERVPFLQEILPELWIYMVVFLAVYIPLSIIIGFWHRRTQLSVENYIRQKESPFFCKLIRTMLDIKTGKASDEEIEEFRKMLSKIETQVDNQRLK